MKDNKTILKRAVKKAVMQNGIEGLTTRTISEAAGVNDALIYRYFKDKDELISLAYELESTEIFQAILNYLDEVEGIPLSFRDKARLHFHRTWREMLSDHERLDFLTSFYHSKYFKNVTEFHKRQAEILVQRLRHLFPSDAVCRQTIYLLMTILYDSTQLIVDGFDADTPEQEDLIFSMSNALLASQLKMNP